MAELAFGKTKAQARGAVGCIFFLQGLCFATWGSRIPAIQERFLLSEAELGALLFTLPMGLMVSLPLTGLAVARVGSRRALIIALSGYALTLMLVGLAPSLRSLTGALFFFGLFANAVNISVNTQAVSVEALYGRPVMSSFHGLWSLAGFTGAAIGLGAVALGAAPREHFIGVGGFVLLALVALIPYLLHDRHGGGAGPAFAWPDRSLLLLGLIAFCSMIAEGTMFDWSGVYFRDVVGAKGSAVGLGYTAFMSTMAGARFLADRFTTRLGVRRMLQVNGLLAGSGLLVAVTFPALPTALLGFFLVGAGVSSVVPLVYSAAGRSGRMAPSSAISAVSSLGFIGFLFGPPFIGFVAGLSSLRWSFFLISLLAFGISFFARRGLRN